MEKNGKIKKIGYLGAYCFVLFLFAFDCIYFWLSQKRQIFHYNKLTECFYGKHVTSFSGVYLWAYIFFILMPVVFFIFWKKKLRTVALFVLLFVLHLAIGSSFVGWLESMDNDGTYDGIPYDNHVVEDGKYEFNAFIPGNYIIRFIYFIKIFIYIF